MKVQPKWIYLMVALFFFFTSAVVTVWLLNGVGPSGSRLPLAEGEKKAEQPQGSPAVPQKVQLETGAALVRIFEGMDGQVHTLPAEPVPEGLLGKGWKEIEAEYPQWSVLELKPQRLMVKVNLTEAALASGTRYLGVHEGKVAIFRGKPGVSGYLEEVTDIPVKWLPEYEQENLRKGQVFEDNELDMILEGFAETAEARKQEE